MAKCVFCGGRRSPSSGGRCQSCFDAIRAARKATPADVLRWRGELHAIDAKLENLELERFVLGRMIVSGRALLHDAAVIEAMRAASVDTLPKGQDAVERLDAEQG